MANKVSYKVRRRRRREGKTNYRKRIETLKSRQPRLVARIKSKITTAQIITYEPEGDKTLLGTNSLELKSFGWDPKRNIPTAYLTGYLLGKKALKNKIKEAIFDIGMQTPVRGGRIFAVLKGAIDAGMNIPHSEKGLPKDEKINGKHIENYRKIKLDVEKIKNKIK